MRWLIDEMLPPATTGELEALGREALRVMDIGLAEADDAVVYATAVERDCVMVTENFTEFAELRRPVGGRTPCVAVVFVRTRDYPRGGALPAHLARCLHRWASGNPEPYPGLNGP